MRKFRELEIWNLGRQLATEVYTLTADLPKEEQYGLSSQMRRAAVSIPSNIAEACSRNSNKEFVRFLEIAIGSAFELETQILISEELNFLESEKSQSTINQINTLQMEINSFIKSLKKF